ncbi:MAG: Ig-like domain-containing protein [Planctomycetota bacterium]|jgi:DNA-binding beta-propeller fold protein YncE
MKKTQFSKLLLGIPLFAALIATNSCSGGGSGSSTGNKGEFNVSLISTGQGQIYPYRIRTTDSLGVPTPNIVNIESIDTLKMFASSSNGVLPVAVFPTTPTLPDGSPGNQFILTRFSNNVLVESILSDSLFNASTNSGLTTAVSLLNYDPGTETQTVIRGRGFVNGFTFINVGGVLQRIRALRAMPNGSVQYLHPVAAGFPGATDAALGLLPPAFNGVSDLVAPNSFTFVADTNDDLSGAPERFDPAGQNLLLRIEVNNGVRNTDGKILEQNLCTATTVGADPNPPDVFGFTGVPAISPGNGQTNVDPATPILVSFNKPVQPTDVGTFFSTSNLTPQAGGVAITVTAAAQTFTVLYYADPLTFADYCNFRLTPAYVLPGEAAVSIDVNAPSIHGLNGPTLGLSVSSPYNTGEGPGLINAPVAPNAIYVGIGGSEPGVGVIDLNGYGQGTSTADPTTSNFTNDPNIGQAGVVPTLTVGTGPIDAGSKGRLTMVEDTLGNIRLLRSPQIGEVGDIHIGPPLDLVFNNLNININVNTSNQLNPALVVSQPGNSISISPHPNPPKLIFPPPNVAMGIFGQEPSVTSSLGQSAGLTTSSPPCLSVGLNLLIQGTRPDYPRHQFDGKFVGPQPPPTSPPPPPVFCPFSSRQQIGHFLYVLDRQNDTIAVVNSNRFTVLDTIKLSDPFNMAFSPTLALAAVTNFASSTVSFIDTNPASPTFNKVVGEVRVAPGPTEVAWQPDGEAILVLSTPSNTLTTILSADLSVQKEVSGNLNAPIAIAVTSRQITSGNSSGVYYAYILNANGTIAVFESGPDGVNGIGFNDMIGTTEQDFRRARFLTFDYNTQQTGVVVTHVDEVGLGVVSRVELTASPAGQQPLTQLAGGFIQAPTFRQKIWSVTRQVGGASPNQPLGALLSGNTAVSVAFDESFNNGVVQNQITPFNSGVSESFLGHSSKGAILQTPFFGFAIPYVPRFMFIALPDAGVIDVFDLESRAKITSIPVPQARVLATYWRQ